MVSRLNPPGNPRITSEKTKHFILIPGSSLPNVDKLCWIYHAAGRSLSLFSFSASLFSRIYLALCFYPCLIIYLLHKRLVFLFLVLIFCYISLLFVIYSWYRQTVLDISWGWRLPVFFIWILFFFRFFLFFTVYCSCQYAFILFSPCYSIITILSLSFIFQYQAKSMQFNHDMESLMHFFTAKVNDFVHWQLKLLSTGTSTFHHSYKMPLVLRSLQVILLYIFHHPKKEKIKLVSNSEHEMDLYSIFFSLFSITL